MKKVSAALSILLLAAFLIPTTGEAQFRLIPKVGLYADVTDLGTVDTADGIKDVGEHETSLAYGLSLDFGSYNTFGFRVTGLYGSDAEVPVGGIGCSGTECVLRTTVLGVSGDVVLRLLPPGSILRPYLAAGAGIKRYDFEFSTDSQLDDAFGDESKFSGVLGVGMDWNLGILKGNVEVTDYISSSAIEDGDRQHDFFVTVGLILGG